MKLNAWMPVALMALAGCASPPRLSCDVDLRDAAGGSALVVCATTNPSSEPVVFKQMAQSFLVRVEDFTVRTAGAAELPLEIRPDQSMGADARLFAERVVRPPDGGELTYRYRVRPGAWMGDDIAGARGRRFGSLGPQGGLLSGRNLFLLPSWYRSIRDIRVTFQLPGNWRVVGTLPWESGAVHLTGADRAASSLIEGTIGVGAYEEASDVTPEGTLHLALHDGIPMPVRDKLRQAVRGGFQFLAGGLGPLGHDLSVVLAAPPSDGSMILVPSGPDGLASEIASAGPVQLYDLFYGMARAWTGPEPSSLRLPPKDLWLKDAIPAYQAVAALEHLGIRSSHDSWLMRGRSARQGRGTLVEPGAGVGEDLLQSRRAKGAWLLALADALAPPAGATAEPAVLRATRRLRQRGDGAGFFDALAAVSGGGLDTLTRLAGSPGGIPAEWVAKTTGVTPLHLTLPPAAAAGARPSLRILTTSGTRGMLEVCGCVARQSGGIARRETIRRALKRQETPVLMVDLGNAFSCDPKEPMLDAVEQRELGLALDLFGRQSYDAMAIGNLEMLRGARFFGEMTRGSRLPYISANLSAAGRRLAPGSRLVKAGALRVAFVSALDPGLYTGEHARFYEEHQLDLDVGDTLAALAAQTRSVRAGADLVIAIGSLSPVLVRRILEEVPGIDVILSTEGPDAAMDGVFQFDTDGETQLFGLHEGRFVLFNTVEGRSMEEIALSLDRRGRIRSADLIDHRLDETVPDAPEFRARLAGFYDELKGDPIISGPEEPVARALPAAMTGSAYVGGKTCRSCHEAEWNDWSETPHGTAFSVLLSRHRNYAPRCVGCHVTGYGLDGGYRIGDPLERLRHVQCEMCHGPGSAHAASPTRLNIRREPPPAACFECHTPAHSKMAESNFEQYYARTRHGLRQAGP